MRRAAARDAPAAAAVPVAVPGQARHRRALAGIWSGAMPISKGDGSLTAVATPAATFCQVKLLTEQLLRNSRLGRPPRLPGEIPADGHASAQVKAPWVGAGGLEPPPPRL